MISDSRKIAAKAVGVLTIDEMAAENCRHPFRSGARNAWFRLDMASLLVDDGYPLRMTELGDYVCGHSVKWLFYRCCYFCRLSSLRPRAQWVNYAPPGTPLTRAGKPNLNAPAPRTSDGKPDLSGVWFHERTSVAEMKRLYGAIIDQEIKVGVPGMEIGTQHKYAFNIFIDYKPPEVPMRTATAELLRQRAAAIDPSNVCTNVPGFPLAGLLSEPIKIVQSPRLTLILYEVDNLHRQIFTDGRRLPKEFALPGYLGYSVGHWEPTH